MKILLMLLLGLIACSSELPYCHYVTIKEYSGEAWLYKPPSCNELREMIELDAFPSGIILRNYSTRKIADGSQGPCQLHEGVNTIETGFTEASGTSRQAYIDYYYRECK